MLLEGVREFISRRFTVEVHACGIQSAACALAVDVLNVSPNPRTSSLIEVGGEFRAARVVPGVLERGFAGRMPTTPIA
jgi:hypothetical protein